jgi:hypothetical protein
MPRLDRKEGTQRDYSDRAWTGLDHECAVRESGRRYRPGKACSRPQISERTGGNPCERTNDETTNGGER